MNSLPLQDRLTDELLALWIRQGNEEKWESLFHRCGEVAFAERVVRLLRKEFDSHHPIARAWVGALQDLHPSLKTRSQAA